MEHYTSLKKGIKLIIGGDVARQQIVRTRVILLYVPNRTKANFQKPNSTTAQPNIANVRFGTKNDFAHPPIIGIFS